MNFLYDKASFIDDPLLKRIGALAFIYSAVCLAEGIGLYLEKAWGEYLTMAITASFLPWEIFEVFHRVTWVRVGLVVVNVPYLSICSSSLSPGGGGPNPKHKTRFAFSSPISHSFF